MPVSGNEEAGVFARPQSSIVPIKKRRFLMDRPPSPSPERPSGLGVNDSTDNQESKSSDQGPSVNSIGKSDAGNNVLLMCKEEKVAHPSHEEEQPSGSTVNDSENKQKFAILDQGPSLDAAMRSPGKSDEGKNSPLMVKKEVTDAKVQSALTISASNSLETKIGSTSVSVNYLGNKVNFLQKEKHAGPEFSGSSTEAPLVIVKETVSENVEGDCNLKLSNSSESVELWSGPKEPLVPAVIHENIREQHKMPDNLDPSLLSLSLSKEKSFMVENSNRISNDISGHVCANRSNWDLNTTMDSWENSVSGIVFLHNTVVCGGLSKTIDMRDVKFSSTSAGLVGKTNDMHNLKSSSNLAGALCRKGNKSKHNLPENSSNSSDASASPSQHHKPVDSLSLSLAMPHRELDSSMEHSAPSGKAVSEFIGLKPNLDELNSIGVNVKLEPNDNQKTDDTVRPTTSIRMSEFNPVKRELVDSYSSGTVLSSSSSSSRMRLVDQRSIKPELSQENTKETIKCAGAIITESVGNVMQPQESSASSVLSNPLTPQSSCPSRLPSFPDAIMNRDLLSQSEHTFHDKEFCYSKDVTDESNLESSKCKQSSDQCDRNDNLKVEISKKCISVLIDEHPLECRRNNKIAGNDVEEIHKLTNILEEDSSGSDCESGRHHALSSVVHEMKRQRDKEDGEYEDGELRESAVRSRVEDSVIEGKEMEKVNLVDHNTGNADSAVFSCDQNPERCDTDGKDTVTRSVDETSTEQIKQCVGIDYHELDKEVGANEKKDISPEAGKPIDSLGRQDTAEGYGKKVSGDSATAGSCETGTTLCKEATDTNIRKSSPGKCPITLPKSDATVNGNNAAKGSNRAGNKSRIITLSRPSNVTSPSKTRSIPAMISLRSGKEVPSDIERDRLQENRGGYFTDGPKRFTRDRAQDQSFRNSRSNVPLSRGRVPGRFDPNRDFASESYSGPSDYWVARRKHGSSVTDVELECNGYDIAPDDAALRGGRRKTLNDELPALHHPSMRRRLSPGGRDGPGTRGARRFPRNISPSRCNNEDDSNLIVLRDDEKYIRDFSDDVVEPVHSRRQSTYEKLDVRVFPGNRNFYQNQSKSHTQTQSPGSWSSPRRRSPDGLPELTQYRSPAMYGGMRRRRSPDPGGFSDEILTRRRGSPSYTSRPPNNLRGVDSEREHIHPRYFNSNRRSSPVQEFPRSTSREGDEYFTGPVHPGRIHRPHQGEIDEGRKFGERMGPLRSFRPYTDDGDNVRFRHINDGQRPFRFSLETDTDFIDRRNMRQRDFDGGIKPRTRIRNIEDQDGDYRPADRVWNDDEFDGLSRAKRRRF